MSQSILRRPLLNTTSRSLIVAMSNCADTSDAANRGGGGGNAAAAVKSRFDGITKSQQDDRLYRGLRLQNGMKVLEKGITQNSFPILT